MVFVGRKNELASLEAQYNSNRFELAIVYGRRRVGKTYLLNHFLAAHEGAYMVGLESGASNNLESLSQAVYRATGMLKTGQLQSTLPAFSTITAALTHLFEYSLDHRVVFIIDEYPYLAESIPSVSSELQVLVDAYKDRSQLMLILCGSSMSFMENQVLGHKSPLYGRRTAQYKIKPFTYIEARQMVPHLSYEDSAIAFGLTGGVAEYLSYFREGDSLDESIISLFFTPTGRLVDEPSSLLKQELREPRQYNAILSAIAKGASRNNEIATKVDMMTGALNNYLKNLIDLQIIEKIHPVGSTSNKSIYAIKDSMYTFWYRFVEPNQGAIENFNGNLVYTQYVKPMLSHFMGPVFETMAEQYVQARIHCGTVPFLPQEMGHWWGTDSRTRQQVEIDLVALADIQKDPNAGPVRHLLVGECKWKNNPIGLDVLVSLKDKACVLHGELYYWLFSKRGFGFIEDNERVELIDLPIMYEI